MPRILSRSGRSQNQLKDQLLKQLQSEGEKILKQMASQFAEGLDKQIQDALQSSLGGWRGGGSGNGTSIGGFSIDGLGNIFSTAITYLANRPHTTRSTRESTRSQAMANAFRLSNSQAAAEATAALGKADKNS
jgi:hypothetical protein